MRVMDAAWRMLRCGRRTSHSETEPNRSCASTMDVYLCAHVAVLQVQASMDGVSYAIRCK